MCNLNNVLKKKLNVKYATVNSIRILNEVSSQVCWVRAAVVLPCARQVMLATVATPLIAKAIHLIIHV